MASTSLDALFPLLQPYVPSAPEATMRAALAAAAQDFLGATHLWREPMYEEPTTPGIAAYPLSASAVVESVLWVLLDNQRLAHTDPRLLDKSTLNQSGRPQRYWVRNDSELVLHPTPNAVFLFTGELALKPSRGATSIPGWLYETWAEAIVDGALWQMMSVPGKPWTAIDVATSRKGRFDRAKANALARDLRQVELRVRPAAF